ncbi:K+-transporting ATPase C subunit [Roseimicrobium gellanilyticum]|uniref:K+-transporting ATPase C subunit n=1 Tax=Roseimicrobium gellanilyticum TaxID=748857 RepID=A0A366HUF2_9BACT|nr:potassium-transporting ATPase subunit C [Roseimicrobium gellanilyticum]RBP47309.1 K+-transporting ATPase C subunit [Roseimicrobium gellanilyticum]
MKTSSHPSSSSQVPLRLLGIYGGAFVALFLFFALTAQFLRMSSATEVPIPDEKAAAQELLEAKLSGPGYFQLGEPSAELPSPYITPAQARIQLDRVVGERHLDAAKREQLENLIKELTEPSPSRMVGTERLNALKLNLALDELK